MRAVSIVLLFLALAAPASAAPQFNTTSELYRACSNTKHHEEQAACLAFLAGRFRDAQSREGDKTCLRHVDNWSTRDLRNRFIYRYRVDMLSESGLKLILDHEGEVEAYVVQALIKTYCSTQR